MKPFVSTLLRRFSFIYSLLFPVSLHHLDFFVLLTDIVKSGFWILFLLSANVNPGVTERLYMHAQRMTSSQITHSCSPSLSLSRYIYSFDKAIIPFSCWRNKLS